jgi:cytosine/adenosine deaminase-related metal-dependent hydrolase/ubiquinone/menaquinone biosynthesis C-methylase UbiE
MSSQSSTRSVSSKEGYRLWSTLYDSQPNPMLSLEHRFLEPLLPPVAGLDVVDLGCGTGRWLEKLALKAPRSIVGIDSSGEMLARASEKLRGRATLAVGDCEAPPLPASCADLILCSFLVSYLANLDRFAEAICRLARPDADVFITDLHPLTESSLGWRRGFRIGDTHFDVATLTWSFAQLLSSFGRVGMRIVAILEPSFGEPESSILEQAGKSTASESLRRFPAIYILQLRHAASSTKRDRRLSFTGIVHEIEHARLAVGPQESLRANIRIDDGRIEFLGCPQTQSGMDPNPNNSKIDLNGYLVLPGLINAHDHLEFALFPRLGNREYRNFSEWADDIHHPDHSPVREHRAVPKDTRLWWGAIRNLLSGVATVCHHNPYQHEVFAKGFLIRVLRDFGWAHSLAMDANAVAKFRDTPRDHPFILHLAEGIDPQSAREIFDLNQAGALGDRTVVVHGLALDSHGMSLLKSCGASLIWCPTSNMFLFGKTHSSASIRDLTSIALGSDSPLTSQGDLLDELRFAHDQVGIAAEEVYAQVTTQAAHVLRLKSGEGSLRVGAVADLIAIRDSGLTPARTLAASSYRDIELVIVAGRVQLASPQLLERLPSHLTEGLQPLDVEGNIRWIRAPLARLYREAVSILAGDLRLNGRTVNYECAI